MLFTQNIHMRRIKNRKKKIHKPNANFILRFGFISSLGVRIYDPYSERFFFLYWKLFPWICPIFAFWRIFLLVGPQKYVKTEQNCDSKFESVLRNDHFNEFFVLRYQGESSFNNCPKKILPVWHSQKKQIFCTPCCYEPIFFMKIIFSGSKRLSLIHWY